MQFPWQKLVFEEFDGLTAACLLGKELHWLLVRNVI